MNTNNDLDAVLAKLFTLEEVIRHHAQNDIEDVKRAAKAARARLNGEWDCPELVAFGPLSPDTEADILRILEKVSQ